jgi:hypothetical protein
MTKPPLLTPRASRYRREPTLELNSGGRKAAAGQYGVAMPILKKLGDLAANKGGNEARKASGAGAAFSAAERQWLEEAMKRLISRR